MIIATQLKSTSSCRHVHSVNNCHLSMNVVTQLTQFVGHDVRNKNTTDLAVCCSTGSVELSCVAIDTPLDLVCSATLSSDWLAEPIQMMPMSRS